ncbi:MAG: YbjN domain-containing protein [Lachnospiraceae bacterium]|nr:YbjN domain-containing protein [Lachnospiraceae bacterium]
MRQENDLLRKRVLKRIGEEFDKVGVTHRFLDRGEESDVDLLLCRHEALGLGGEAGDGQYFFLEYTAGAEDVQYFCAMITGDFPVDPDYIPLVHKGLTELNFFLPVGAFSTDETGDAIHYKLVLPLPEELSEEALFRQVNIGVGHALSLCRQWLNILSYLARGEIGVDELLSSFLENMEESE